MNGSSQPRCRNVVPGYSMLCRDIRPYFPAQSRKPRHKVGGGVSTGTLWSELSRPLQSSRSEKGVDAQKPAHLLGWRLDRHVNAPPTLRAWSVGSRVGVSIRRTIDQDRCCSWVRQRSWVRPREPRERTDCGDKRTEKRCWRGRNRCAVQIVSEPRQLKHHPPQRRSSRRKTASATYRAA